MIMKLNFGMIGGGNNAHIGNFHRHGALMDDLCVLVAGCFTRDMEQNLATAEKWNVTDKSRIYPNYQVMAEQESQRKDGIDFVSIATPNNTHYDIAKTFLEHGIHVMCDKPLALEVKEGEELAALAKKKALLFGMTYTYAGYPMPHQAREIIRNGEIGKIVYIVGEYPQEWVAVTLGTGVSTRKSTWRLDPALSGKCGSTADIGTHLEHLLCFISGLELKSVLARFEHIPATQALETNSSILLRFEGDVPGMMWTSQIAYGNECTVSVRIFGEKGSIEWRHLTPDVLKVTRMDQPPQYYTPNRSYLYEKAKKACRLPYGNHEGTYEAFGTLYRGFCNHLLAKKTGGDPGLLDYPTVYDGVQGLKFVDACYESNAKGNVWVDLK
jgi:predicted dehydrogenase